MFAQNIYSFIQLLYRYNDVYSKTSCTGIISRRHKGKFGLSSKLTLWVCIKDYFSCVSTKFFDHIAQIRGKKYSISLVSYH